MGTWGTVLVLGNCFLRHVLHVATEQGVLVRDVIWNVCAVNLYACRVSGGSFEHVSDVGRVHACRHA